MKTMRKRLNRTFCFLVAAVAMVTSGTLWAENFTWDTGTNGAWNIPNNWDSTNPFDFPGPGDNATQDNSFTSHIEVTGNRDCANFTGNGDSPNDRYLLLKASNTWTIGTDLAGSGTSKYLVRMQNGSSGSPSTVEVTGDVTDMHFLSGTRKGQDADYAKIDVSGNMTEADITIGDDADIDVSGDVTSVAANGAQWFVENNGKIDIFGTAYGVAMNIGGSTFSTGDGTVMKVGDIGTVANVETRRWALLGNTKLFVTDDTGYGNGDFVGSSNFAPKVDQLNNSEITVEGFTDEGWWRMFDDSTFTGKKEINDGKWHLRDESVVTAEADTVGGTWVLYDDSRFVATTGDVQQDGAGFADWTVNSNGTVANPWGIDMVSGGTQEFNPSMLTVDTGKVRADHIGYIAGLGGGDVIWDSYFKGNAEVEANKRSEWAGCSLTSYEGTKNVFRHNGVQNGVVWEGPFKRVNSTSELEIEINQSGGQGYLTIDSQLTINENGSLKILDYEVQGVTITMKGSNNNAGTLEAVGPDYDEYWLEVSGSPVRPFFEDVPCTKRWAAVDVPSGIATLQDGKYNSIISGYNGGTSNFVRDAVYTIDLNVASGAIMHTGTPNGTGQELIRVYTTNTAVIDGNVYCAELGQLTTDCSQHVIELDCVTQYGNFNCNLQGAPLDDQEDVDFFNEAYPSSKDDTTCTPGECYNPLVDYNCDGEIDCCDREQLLANWPSYTNVEGATACASFTCPTPGDVCQ